MSDNKSLFGGFDSFDLQNICWLTQRQQSLK